MKVFDLLHRGGTIFDVGNAEELGLVVRKVPLRGLHGCVRAVLLLTPDRLPEGLGLFSFSEFFDRSPFLKIFSPLRLCPIIDRKKGGVQYRQRLSHLACRIFLKVETAKSVPHIDDLRCSQDKAVRGGEV